MTKQLNLYCPQCKLFGGSTVFDTLISVIDPAVETKVLLLTYSPVKSVHGCKSISKAQGRDVLASCGTDPRMRNGAKL